MTPFFCHTVNVPRTDVCYVVLATVTARATPAASAALLAPAAGSPLQARHDAVALTDDRSSASKDVRLATPRWSSPGAAAGRAALQERRRRGKGLA